MKYNLSNIYPYIYKEKFGVNKFISTLSGYIHSDVNVYLDIKDLNLIENLKYILDFYSYVEISDCFIFLNIPSVCKCNTFTSLCLTCNSYICNDCENIHKNHKIQKNINYKLNGVCDKCFKHTIEPMINLKNKTFCINCLENSNYLENIVNYSKPVLARINMYEWIPTKYFLENRNINSSLYKRKLGINMTNGYITLKLLNKKVDEYEESIQQYMDSIFRIFEKYNVSDNLEKIIIDMCNFKKNINFNTKYYEDIIILE